MHWKSTQHEVFGIHPLGQYKLFPESYKSWRMYAQRKSRSLFVQTCRFRQEDVF